MDYSCEKITPFMSLCRVRINASGRLLSAWFSCPEKAPERVAVLLHGLCSDAAELKDLITALSEEGVAALAPDLPGHGESDGPMGLITLPSQLKTIGVCVDWLHLRFPFAQVVLMGHSFGAHAVLVAASLITPPPVLVAIVGPPRYSGENLGRLKWMIMRFIGVLTDWGATLPTGVTLRCPSSFDSRSRRFSLKTLGYAARIDNRVAVASVPSFIDGLVVRGADDPDTTSVSVTDLFNRIGSRRKKLIEIPGAGHAPFHGRAATILAKVFSGAWNECAE